MAFRREKAFADPAAGIGAVENRQMLGPQMRRPLDRHGATDIGVGGVDFSRAEAQLVQHVKGHVIELVLAEAQDLGAEFGAKRPLVEREADIESRGERLVKGRQRGVGKALFHQSRGIHARRAMQTAMANRIGHHLVDLGRAITQLGQRHRHQVVDDFEIAAARQFLEFNNGEIGFDPGGIAIHHQTDGPGRRDYRRLGVAIAVFFAQSQSLVPGRPRRRHQGLVGAVGAVQRHRRHGQALIPGGLAQRRPAMIADHPKHVVAVFREAREGAKFAGHFRRGGVGHAGHQSGNRPAKLAPLLAVVGQAAGHQQAADIGETQTQRAIVIGPFGDFLGRELGHQDRDFQGDGPQAHGMLEAGDVKGAIFVAEAHQVQGGQVARRVVEEHILRTWVGGVDPAAHRAGMPFVDGGVVLQARIGAGPGGMRNLVPQRPGVDGFMYAAVGAPDEIPFATVAHRLQKGVGNPHRVIRVLTRNGQIGFGVPVGVVGFEIDFGEPLACELDHPLDIIFRDHDLTRGDDRAPQGQVFLRLEAVVTQGRVAVDTGRHHLVEMLLG